MQDVEYTGDGRREYPSSRAVEGNLLTVGLFHDGVGAVGDDEDIVGVGPADPEGAGVGILAIVISFEIQQKRAAAKDEWVLARNVSGKRITIKSAACVAAA